MNKNKFSSIIITAGALLVFASLLLLIYNEITAYEAGNVIDLSAAEWDEEDEEIILLDNEEESVAVVTLDGNTYMGYITIPSLGLNLPVLSEWSYTNLKIAPCRYSGTADSGNLIICGHNYTTHFGMLKNLTVGDDIYYVSIDGTVYHYTVTELETLAGTAVEEMISSDYDLTLFTCTYSGQSRVTVRCTLQDID